MQNLLSEIYISFKEKISSSFFRYFTISWILWNYKFVYFIFFQNQEVFFRVHEITKFDYLISNVFFYETWYISILLCLVLPILSTLFFIYIFPKYNKLFLIKYIKNSNEEFDEKQKRRKKIKLWDLEIAKISLEEIEAENKIIEEEVKQKEVIKEKEINQFDDWKKEYEDFNKKEVFNIFNEIISLINFHDWYFLDKYGDFFLNQSYVSYLLANKIIKRKDKSPDFHIFTEKWEYFAKLYLDENSK